MKLGEISTTQEQFAAKIRITARWREPSLDTRQSTIGQLQVTPCCIFFYFLAVIITHCLYANLYAPRLNLSKAVSALMRTNDELYDSLITSLESSR